MTRKYESNSEFISAVMNNSHYGAMKQAFIISALDEYSRQILEGKIDMDEHYIISPSLWRGIAKELTDELAEQYGERS